MPGNWLNIWYTYSMTDCSLLWCCDWKGAGFHFNSDMLGNAELLENQEDLCILETQFLVLLLLTPSSELGISIKVTQGRRLCIWMLLSQALHAGTSLELSLSPVCCPAETSQPFLLQKKKRHTADMSTSTNINHKACPNQMWCNKIVVKSICRVAWWKGWFFFSKTGPFCCYSHFFVFNYEFLCAHLCTFNVPKIFSKIFVKFLTIF